MVGRNSLKLLVESPSILNALLEVSPSGNTSIGKSPETRRNVVKALRRFGKATCLDGESMLAHEMSQHLSRMIVCLETRSRLYAMNKDKRQLVQNK